MSSPEAWWRPSAGIATLQVRARVFSAIRAFFARRGVLEVDCPLLSAGACPDPQIEPFVVRTADGPRYLHTSPELAMKRLLAAGSGDVYSLGHVFRRGEQGRRHNPEFTLLEWYRTGWDGERLMGEVAELVAEVFPQARRRAPERITYAAAFDRSLDVDPFRAGTDELADAAGRRGVSGSGDWDRRTWLDWLFAEAVARDFAPDRLTFVVDFPPDQAALARLRPGAPPVAERFEAFWGDLELANGFTELTDANEQRRRFEHEAAQRRARGLDPISVDERFLAALETGLPDCAGVALGVDRLLMLVCGADQLAEVLPFAWDRA